MLGDLNKMMQQVKDMKSQMKVAQKELQGIVLEGSSRGDKVNITINGEMEVQKVTISPELQSGKLEDLESNIMSAMKDAISKAKKTAADKLGKLTGGLNIPGL